MSPKRWGLIHVHGCNQIAAVTARDPSTISSMADLFPGILFPVCRSCKEQLDPSDVRVRYFKEVKL